MSVLLKPFDSLMRSQHGIVTGRQLGRKLSRSNIAWLVRSKQLIRVYRGVYRAVGAPLDHRAAIHAAVLAGGAGCVASHTSALVLHDLPTFGIANPHITTARGDGQHTKVKVHRVPVMPASMKIERIRVTTLPVTLVDCVGLLTPSQVREVCTKAVVTRRTTYAEVHRELLRRGTKGRKGAGEFLRWVETQLPLPDTQSELMPRILRAIAAAGLPQPSLEYRVAPEGHEYFLDGAWPELFVAIEVDDYGSHGTSRRAFDNDRRRENRLKRVGWIVIQLTSAMSDTEIVEALAPFLRRPAQAIAG